jgi:predicted amidohydrolase YtcJ
MIFHDPHCHILPTGLDLQKLHLGSAESHSDVMRLLQARHTSHPDGWLLAVHYDQTRYEGIHLTRRELDEISAERPILLRHVNGHASVANSAALRAAGVDASTPDPVGGEYRRDANGEPDGVLFELAHEFVTGKVPMPSVEEMTDAILAAGASMAAYGIASATDMMTGWFDLERELTAYQRAAERGCAIETRLFLQYNVVFGKRAMPGDALLQAKTQLEATGRSRIDGIKVFADGAIGSATAAIYGAYEGQPDAPFSGQLIYSVERLNSMVQTAHDAGWQIAVHTIGDRSTDLVMDAYEATGDPSRHRIEHAMILSDAQIERLARLNCWVTMQPEFLRRFGHSYLRQLGPERASKLKRVKSVLDAGIRLCFSSDRPIVAGDPRDGIEVAVNRPAGFDPSENISQAEAERLYTTAAAEISVSK